MVRVPINKKRHLIALLLTLSIFVIGFLIGYSLQGERINYIQLIGKEQRLEFDSLQLQSLYVSSLLQEENCAAIGKALERNVDTLEKTRARIESFIKDNKGIEEYDLLKREYTLEQLRYWFLARETKTICKQDALSVLYFYASEDVCDDCRTQGSILTNLKNQFHDKVLVFALDASFLQEPLVALVKESFNVTSLPTIIIENEPFPSFTSQDTLGATFCSLLRTQPEICENYDEV